MRFRVLCLGCLGGFLLTGLAGPADARAPELGPELPRPAGLRAQVDFWIRIYVEVATDRGLVHDDRYLAVVYETVDARHGEARKRHWRDLLVRLARGAAGGEEGQAVRDQWRAALGRAPQARDFRAAARRLRFQRGLREKFRAGLVRSGAYEAEIRRILRGHRVPEALVYLPHVESSFDPRAHSKAGAAGMWQFTSATARRYLTVDPVVDERWEPIASTRAAAKLLRANYDLLGTWPLAITAYNHGAAGMRRARDRLGTTDIERIVNAYRSRSFRFASRNFYAQFLAAAHAARNAECYFGTVPRARPATIPSVRLPAFADANRLSHHLQVAPRELARLNPSLRGPVLRSEKYIPAGYRLRLPRRVPSVGAAWFAELPPGVLHPAQRKSRVHRVREGETLSHIAVRYGTTVTRLVDLNRLRDRHRIFPGQELAVAAQRPTRGGVQPPPRPGPRAAPPAAANGPASPPVAPRSYGL